LTEFSDLFVGLGKVEGVLHHIKVPENVEPNCAPLRRKARTELDQELAFVQEWVDKGVLEPCTSLWATYNVLVTKASGGYRLTTDFRKLNSLTEADTFPLEDMKAVLDWLGGKQVMSTLDMRESFFQIVLAEESRPLTAIRTPLGLYQYTRMPQGLKNSPATLQRVIITRRLKRENSICVHGLSHRRIIGRGRSPTGPEGGFQRLRKRGVKLKFHMCCFGRRSVDILEHRLTSEGLQPNEVHLSAVRHYPEPYDRNSLLRSIGICRLFEAFLPDLPRRIQPLYEVLVGTNWKKKKRKAVSEVIPEWDSRWKLPQQEAFRDLRSELSNPCILVTFSAKAEKILVSDASEVGVGVVLLQKGAEGRLRPLGFASRKFKAAEQRYTVSEQDC